MSQRPAHIDLPRVDDIDDLDPASRHRFHLDLPSPRVGEIPPALSPLDAFAQQSRLLAKRFEAQQNGRRISRLDAGEVAHEMGRRPTYFTRRTDTSRRPMFDDCDDEDDTFGPLPNLDQVRHDSTAERPVSHYPIFGSNDEPPVEDTTPRSETWQDTLSLRSNSQSHADGYFGVQMPRAHSPEQFEQRPGAASPAVPSLSGSIDSMGSSQPRTNTDDSIYPQRQTHGLAPPASPNSIRQQRSIISIKSIMDGSDDGPLQPPQKIPGSHHAPRATSPFTPDPHMTSRSPSIRSDHSAFQDEFHRPSFNFSRPLSSGGKRDGHGHRPTYSQSYSQQYLSDARSSLDVAREPSPLRKTSMSSHGSRPNVDDGRSTPTFEQGSQHGEDASSIDGRSTPGGAHTYVYSKYSLPRGRTVEQLPMDQTGMWDDHQIRWEEQRNMNTNGSPKPAQRAGRPFKGVIDTQKARSQSADGRSPVTPRGVMHRPSPSSPSIHSQSTDRTIKAHARNSPSQDIVNMTAEQHLEKGIECHSSGSLSKSTYHLRHAARAGHPTGMLLYALACRHGWGMRANPSEGVQWLRKAVDSTNLELLEGTSTTINNNTRPHEPKAKTQKTEFALAVYELGMSYMNGWGTPKDKPLAVRCFEVAGDWGDCDALAEAGFCYTQGVGCKKDLKKAAGLYRKAAEGGMSMAGNSWIFKPKYLDDPGATTAGAEKSAKSGRSRTRSLFGRKKSVAGAAAVPPTPPVLS